ncbi:MAG: uracil phosphoribosyltransferase [Propionicimonas sp.]
MKLCAPEHPLIAHKVTLLRDVRTDAPTLRALVGELMNLLAYEATREVRVQPRTVETPLCTTTGVELSHPRPLVVPILRAGLAMLDGMMQLVPSAEVGFVGMIRDEETLQPFTYAERLPRDLSGRQCYVLDPMLATGGSLGGAVEFLAARGADEITCICLLAAPEGIAYLGELTDRLGVPCTLVTSSVEEGLDEHGYIVPGLGDAGDRLYGVAG